eukprot:TRINITY_DN3738_c0_g1_i1.p1 TRINITY_DN3738_c0_g1~~TRINITY_DN3738_c0_g1_i1.p1  ORF type:complete len:923 (+),score=119.02 TRINITY_DN3738_c0_g1_i1:23-2770(+)
MQPGGPFPSGPPGEMKPEDLQGVIQHLQQVNAMSTAPSPWAIYQWMWQAQLQQQQYYQYLLQQRQTEQYRLAQLPPETSCTTEAPSTPAIRATAQATNPEELIFPWQVSGVLTIFELGTVVPLKGYQHQRFTYPVGFRSQRRYHDYLKPSQKVDYTCEIFQKDDRALFKVTHPQDTENVIIKSTPSQCWLEVYRRLQESRSISDPTVKPPSSTPSGNDYFGLSNPKIMELIAKMTPEATDPSAVQDKPKRKRAQENPGEDRATKRATQRDEDADKKDEEPDRPVRLPTKPPKPDSEEDERGPRTTSKDRKRRMILKQTQEPSEPVASADEEPEAVAEPIPEKSDTANESVPPSPALESLPDAVVPPDTKERKKKRKRTPSAGESEPGQRGVVPLPPLKSWEYRFLTRGLPVYCGFTSHATLFTRYDVYAAQELQSDAAGDHSCPTSLPVPDCVGPATDLECTVQLPEFGSITEGPSAQLPDPTALTEVPPLPGTDIIGNAGDTESTPNAVEEASKSDLAEAAGRSGSPLLSEGPGTEPAPHADLQTPVPLDVVLRVGNVNVTQSVYQLRCMWEFASALHMLQTILQPVLRLPQFIPEELEQALLADKDTAKPEQLMLLHSIHYRLVVREGSKTLFYFNEEDDGPFLDHADRLDTLLRLKLSLMCREGKAVFEGGQVVSGSLSKRNAGWTLPDINPLEFDTYLDLPPELKVLVLFTLCEDCMELDEVRHHMESGNWRTTALCRDGEVAYYWFSEHVGRLYAEHQPLDREAPERKTKRNKKPNTGGWYTVCASPQEAEKLLSSLPESNLRNTLTLVLEPLLRAATEALEEQLLASSGRSQQYADLRLEYAEYQRRKAEGVAMAPVNQAAPQAPRSTKTKPTTSRSKQSKKGGRAIEGTETSETRVCEEGECEITFDE